MENSIWSAYWRPIERISGDSSTCNAWGHWGSIT